MNLIVRNRLVATAAAGLLTVTGLAGCPSPSASQPTNNNPAPAETPDCDLGDMIEGDSDCESASDKAKRKSKEKAAKERKAAEDRVRRAVEKNRTNSGTASSGSKAGSGARSNSGSKSNGSSRGIFGKRR